MIQLYPYCSVLFATLETSGELEPKCVPQVLLGSLLGTWRSLAVSYWPLFVVLSYKHSQKSWRKFSRPSFRLSCKVANLHLLYVCYTPKARSSHPTLSIYVVRYWYVFFISKKESSSSLLGGSWMCQRFLRGVLASNTALTGNVIKNLKSFSFGERKVVTTSKFSVGSVPPSMMFLILFAVVQ